jgi:hypothetical protein
MRPFANLRLVIAVTIFATAACGDGDHAAKPELPCDVRLVLSQHCQGCHQTPGQFGAPMPLLDYADLHAATPDDPSTPVYKTLHARVHDAQSPMPPPPNPVLEADELKVLDAWVKKGAPPAKADDQCSLGELADAGPAAIYGALGQAPDDCDKFYEFHAHGDESTDSEFHLDAPAGNDQNRYQCFYFTPPWGSDDVTLWMHSMIDNSKVLHHWILYGTDRAQHPSGSSAPCAALETDAYFIAGWAPGGGDFQIPTNVEVDLPSGSNAGLILEVHYFNATGKAADDHTGVRVCTAKRNTRAHLAAVHFTGSEGICLEPGQTTTVTGMCEPRQDEGDIHIVGLWPHMHKLGRRMKVSVLRADGTTEIIHDDAFDFNLQLYYPFAQDRWILHPGDHLQTDCIYTNDTNAPVHFGERTQDEMCYGFVMAWPAGALENDPKSLSQAVGGPFQQERRCLNPLGILQSCNGLADVPTPPADVQDQ